MAPSGNPEAHTNEKSNLNLRWLLPTLNSLAQHSRSATPSLGVVQSACYILCHSEAFFFFSLIWAPLPQKPFVQKA